MEASSTVPRPTRGHVGENGTASRVQQEKTLAAAIARNSLPPETQLLRGTTCSVNRHHRIMCVYFLVRDSVVVYIGQSVHLRQRLRLHGLKDYDAVLYLPCIREQLTPRERLWTARLQPEYNSDRDRSARPFKLSRRDRQTRNILAYDHEYETWSKAAARANKSVSQWLRDLANAAARSVATQLPPALTPEPETIEDHPNTPSQPLPISPSPLSPHWDAYFRSQLPAINARIERLFHGENDGDVRNRTGCNDIGQC